MVEIDVGNVKGPAWGGGAALEERQTALEGGLDTTARLSEAYRKWDPEWDYVAYDPTFYNGTPYYANPISVPSVGESPITHPYKWINPMLQATEIDLSQAMSLIEVNTAKIATLWTSIFGGLVSNPFLLTFDNIDDVELESGVWNQTARKIEC